MYERDLSQSGNQILISPDNYLFDLVNDALLIIHQQREEKEEIWRKYISEKRFNSFVFGVAGNAE